MRLFCTALAALALVAACTPSASPPTRRTVAASAEVLPFIENDYPAAIAMAKERKLPLFIDVWAPW